MNNISIVVKNKENNEPLYKGRITEINISLNARIEYLENKETYNLICYKLITENNISKEEYKTLVNRTISQLKQNLLTENIYTKKVIQRRRLSTKKDIIKTSLQFEVIRNPQFL